MKVYQVDWAKLVENLLPSFMRNPLIIAWLKVLTSPVAALHTLFLNFTVIKRKEASFNGQTIKLRELLNQRYDPVLKRITITNYLQNFQATFIYPFELDNNSVVLYPFESNSNETVLYPFQNLGTSEFNFTVDLPQGLAYDVTEMSAIIDRYKLYGTTYYIQSGDPGQ